MPKIKGTNRNDNLNGTSVDDSIYALGGDDIVNAGAGNDYVELGDGNDTGYGNGGSDTLLGGRGNDELDGGHETDTITFRYDSTTNASGVGGSPTEAVSVIFTFDSNLANGTGSFDPSPTSGSYGPWSGTLMVGTDVVSLTGGTIEVFNDAGTDTSEDGYDFRWDSARGESSGILFGSTLSFFRILLVDTDHDMFSSVNLPNDPSFATKSDFIQDDYFLTNGQSFGQSEGPGTSARSFTFTGDSAIPDPEKLYGEAGNDHLVTYKGNDYLNGGADQDRLEAGSGNDSLYGEAGNDFLHGQDGDDYLNGGLGQDSLYGGAGKDTFDFDSAKESIARTPDIIRDFSGSQGGDGDVIDLAALNISSVASLSYNNSVLAANAPGGNHIEIFLEGNPPVDLSVDVIL